MIHATTVPLSLVAAAFALAGSTLRGQCTCTWPAAALGSGCNDGITALHVTPAGQVVAGGRFTASGGLACSRIAAWDGSSWSALGSGMDGDVHALATSPNGDLIAGGTFSTAGGVPAAGVARWNGTAWSNLGINVDPIVPFGASVQALAWLPNGDLVIAGSFAAVNGVPCANIARWTGATVQPLGSGCNGTVRALAVAPNGDLLATGSFLTAGGALGNGVARWNGVSWTALGAGLGWFGGSALAVLANGDVVVGGSFVAAGGIPANHIARWSGGAWSALGAGTNGAVATLLALPNGDLVAGGLFTQAAGAAANYVARWNGSGWSPLAGGTNAAVSELSQLPNGDLLAAGEFTSANGSGAGRIARIVSSCAPTVATLGSGCSGSGGANTLVATQLPLLGGSFRATATGMPAAGLVLAVTGLTPTSLALNLALPQALPGCTLYANPDLVDVLLPAAGIASSSLAFAANPSILGALFVHQYVPLELDPAFNITAVTSSNALQVTIGSF